MLAHEPPKKRTKVSNPLEKYESDESRGLTNTELQRLVLLKQLEVLKLKAEKLKRDGMGKGIGESYDFPSNLKDDQTYSPEDPTYLQL